MCVCVYVCVSVCVCVCVIWFGFILSYPIYQPLRSGRIWHKVNF